jgi:hypothetical protein
MMQGATMAKRQVSDFLADRMPARLIAYRNEWNKSADELPDPVGYITYEPQELAKFPAVITIVMSTSKVSLADYDGDEPEYRVTYQMRTYVWVTARGGRSVTDKRDDLVTVLRDLLMDVPGLDHGPCKYRVKEDTIREEFSDLEVINPNKDTIIGGAYIGYDLESYELLNRDGLGTVGWGTGLGVAVTVDQIDAVANAPKTVRAEDMGSGAVDLTWYPSTWEGGKVLITGYKVESSVDSGSTWITSVINTASREGLASVTGLTIGNAYLFRVAGINSEGTGASSASSNEVTLA